MPGPRQIHVYPYPPRTALVELRKKKFPGMRSYTFAGMLGVTRLHMTAIEVGRKPASLALALKWMEVLGPEAKLSMFEPIYMMDEHLATMRRLKKVSPELYKAA